MILIFIVKSKKWRRLLIGILVLFSFVFTSNRLYIRAVNYWSASYQVQLKNNQRFEIAIVAGGSVAYSQSWEQVDFNEKADRITEAIRLYRLGTVKKLYLSGESAFNVKEGISYAPEFLQYMQEMGVDPKDIILEKRARTTAENVKYLKEILKDQNPEIPILLIN